MEKKISIITPVYNCEKYIEKNILSIKNQNYSNYEHIILDGGSTDGTLDIIKKYENTYPMKYISEKDEGMYDAIGKGFAMADGEIFAWLNADDTYLPWAFQIMNYAMQQEGVQWCTGVQGIQNERDVFWFNDIYYYNRDWIKSGYYDGRVLRFIQQESTFWTRELYLSIHGRDVIKKYNMAGDFALWRAMAEKADLYTVHTAIAGFRKHGVQKTSDMQKYYAEIPEKHESKIEKKYITILDRLFNGSGIIRRNFYKDACKKIEANFDV